MLPTLKCLDQVREFSETGADLADGPDLAAIAAQFTDLTETILQRLG